MLLERTLAPVLTLVGEGLVQAADRAGAGSHFHHCLGHFSSFVGARASYEHLRQPFGDVRF